MGFLADKAALLSVLDISNQTNVTSIINKKTSIIHEIFVPIFGLSFMNQIGSYETSSTQHEVDLFTNINQSIMKLAVQRSIPEREIRWSDAGLQRLESENNKTAFASQVSRLSDSLLNEAYSQLDSAISICYSSSISGFSSTPIYQSLIGLIFKTAAEFCEFQKLHHPYITFYYLSPKIKLVHDKYVSNRFTSGALNIILTSSSNLVVKDVQFKLKIAVAYLTICHAIKSNLVTVDQTGVKFIGASQEQSYTEELAPNESSVSTQIKEYESIGVEYLQKASEIVRNNPTQFGMTSDQFPTPPAKTQFFA